MTGNIHLLYFSIFSFFEYHYLLSFCKALVLVLISETKIILGGDTSIFCICSFFDVTVITVIMVMIKTDYFISNFVSWNSEGFHAYALVHSKSKPRKWGRKSSTALEHVISIWFALTLTPPPSSLQLFLLGSLGHNTVLVFLCLGLFCQLLFFYFNLRCWNSKPISSYLKLSPLASVSAPMT